MNENLSRKGENEPSIKIENGTKAYLIPDFGWINEMGCVVTPTLTEMERGLNKVMQDIENQGGQVIGLFTQKVELDKDLYRNGRLLQNRRRGNVVELGFILVKKP